MRTLTIVALVLVAIAMPAQAESPPPSAEWYAQNEINQKLGKSMAEESLRHAQEVEEARRARMDAWLEYTRTPEYQADLARRRAKWTEVCKPRLQAPEKSYELAKWVYAQPGCAFGP